VLVTLETHDVVVIRDSLLAIDAALQGYIDADDDDLPIDIFDLTDVIRGLLGLPKEGDER
jgi:hypothetical protein